MGQKVQVRTPAEVRKQGGKSQEAITLQGFALFDSRYGLRGHTGLTPVFRLTM